MSNRLVFFFLKLNKMTWLKEKAINNALDAYKNIRQNGIPSPMLKVQTSGVGHKRGSKIHGKEENGEINAH